MSFLNIGIGLTLISVGIILMYQGPFINMLGPIDELIERIDYLMITVFLPLVFIISGGLLIKRN